MRINILFIFFSVSILTAMLGGAVPVYSATFNVTTTQDNVPGSLRATITAANTNGEDDIIYLPAGTYILSGAADDDDNLSGDLDIDTTNTITIIGDTPGTTIIDGNEVDRVLHILNGTVSISGVSIQNGKTRDGENNENGGDGGGIYNSGTLSLTNCIIIGNITGNGGLCSGFSDDAGSGGNGGGIYNGGTLNLTNCDVINNTSGTGGDGWMSVGHCYYGDGGSGGGIYNAGTQTLTDCNINNNTTGNGGYDGADGNWGGNGGNGGGIYSSGTQTLINCFIKFNTTGDANYTECTGCTVQGGNGGGICTASGNTTVSTCVISNNTTGGCQWNGSGGHGGGIYNSGSFIISDSMVRNNTTGSGDHGGYGGGIYNSSTLSLTACTVSNNQTGSSITIGGGGRGGGIFNISTLSLINCTVSSNITGNGFSYDWITIEGNGGDGGGICNSKKNANLNLTNCTICNNTTGSKGNDPNEFSRDGRGGGLYNVSGIIIIKNTITANNHIAAEGEGPDCYGWFYSQGYNLIKNTNQSTISGDLTGNITGVDPMLVDLAENGGTTRTHALLPGSPAIDAGNSSGIFKDQRGFSRPVDIPGIANVSESSDIGAYEFVPSTAISGTITYGGAGLAGVTLTFSGSGGTTTSDENGNYSHVVSYGWSGTVKPSKSGYTFIPANRSYSNVTANYPNQDFTAVTVVPPQISLNRTQLCFGADTAGHQTGSQTILIANSGGGILNWTLSTSANWLNCTPTSGSNSGDILVSLDPSGLSIGTHNSTIIIKDPNASNSPRNVTVTLKVYDPSYSQAPFGSFDTPLDGSTVVSSIPVTGWVIDNIGIESVKIYRNPVPGEGSGLIYIGDATLVEGARPDVEALYPDYPMSEKAGWGYMMLTNFLPNQGNGTFTIHARAADKEGNIAALGQKTIICDNENAVKPFGAIDTPAQGGTASGSNFVNFGWALTPLPNNIPTDGSTITVWVDGLPLGHPVYNQYRADIAALFPGYNNSNGAVGYYYLDTTQYENGVHTIQWTVTDDAGNTDGIGSRYFTIQNTGESRTKEKFKVQGSYQRFNVEPSQIPVYYSQPVRVKKGYNNTEPQTYYTDKNGKITIEINELERLEIHLFEPGESTLSITPLPIGSTFDSERGVFFWQPGPGYRGEYKFVFITQWGKKQIIINIHPLFTNNGEDQ